jgi:UDP-glucose 4-epimerase
VAILVTGGAGYIGGHVVAALRERGDEVVVVDDLSAGRAERIPGVRIEQIDLAAAGAAAALADVLRDARIDGVIHLAARKRVDESVERPLWYHEQNGGGTLAVLEAATAAGVGRVVFSSTAAVYASSDEPVTEDSPTVPANPYGETKLTGEWMLRAQAATGALRGVSLRYFNVAGAASPELADAKGGNVVPMVLDRIEAGEAPRVFGDDYPTRDGTCVRDYIHVSDVATAHLAALDALSDGPAYRVYNIGTGTGTSVRELVDALLAVAGSSLEPIVEPRRAGDPAVVVADASRIRTELGWQPRHDLADIVGSAWRARHA